jgi:hypothetical protein
MARMNNGYIGVDKRSVLDGVISLNKQALQPTMMLDRISSASLAGAWGLRKLRSSYAGNACEVRNSSSNALLEIGFSNQNLNTTQLASHVSSNNGLISSLFDQSGNARHLAQATSASQPKLVSSGTVEVINTKPAILWDGSDDALTTTNLIAGLTNNNAFSIVIVWQKVSASFSAIVNQGKNASYYHFGLISDNTNNGLRWRNTNNDFLFGGNTNTTSQLQIISVVSSGGVTEAFRNGSSIGTTSNGITASGTISGDELAVGKRGGSSSEYLNARISEIVIYTRALSSTERQTLEADCSAYYGITI